MKNVFFLNHDYNMHERQSDGVELCTIPEFFDNKIYFYCSEYVMFWDKIEDVGDFDKCCNFKLKGKILPATLEEICSAKLCNYIDSVKEYTIENSKILEIKYINLK
ncbi:MULTISPECIES: hypothetical protein [unclassified Vibrio]|uniref:hypothetical protein n=1 Tax=unclassified Vibrio TaxID=2614977 RepID=UPI002F41FA0C